MLKKPNEMNGLCSQMVIFKKLMRGRNQIGMLPFLIVIPLLLSCATNKKLTVGAAALLLEDVVRSSSRQSDLRVIQAGTPAYLMLMDGMVEAWPENERLLIAAAQGYASFASTLEKDPGYVTVLYGKARNYALKSLEQRGLENPSRSKFEDLENGLKNLGKDDVPYLFWAASCWGSWIGSNANSMEALAELPRVELMMRRMLELDETYYYGGPHLFMGMWYAIRPKMAGGNLDKSKTHFQTAIQFGQGKFLMAYVYYAEHYAKRAFDRKLFESLLQNVLDTPADILPDLTLINSVAKKKAKEMLGRVEEYF
jgi:hypothetical protein